AFIKLSAGVALTIAATSFRWVNVIWEFDWLSHNSDKWATGYYQYSAWFFPNVLQERELFLYVLASWLFDISILLTIGLSVPAIIYLVNKRDERHETTWRILFAAVITAWFAFFMMAQPSKFIWDSIPFLQKIQFPWRWLSVLSMLSVTAFALAVPKVLSMFRSRERLFAYPALALVVAIILFDITQIIIPSNPIPHAKFSEVEEEIATKPMFEGWWPVWARHDAFTLNSKAYADGRQIEIFNLEQASRVVNVASGTDTDLILPSFYYPHWAATADGQPATVSFNENGVIKIPITGNAVSVRLYFEEPMRNVIAGWISLSVWLGFGFLLLLHYARDFTPWLVRRPSLEQRFDNG
ncbi:MAG TPA: hypothetical protein VFZ23_10125, partial [Pyrinomonadaceae bacterium]